MLSCQTLAELFTELCKSMLGKPRTWEIGNFQSGQKRVQQALNGPNEQNASCSGAQSGCTDANEVLDGAKDSWKTFAPWVPETFCTLP